MATVELGSGERNQEKSEKHPLLEVTVCEQRRYFLRSVDVDLGQDKGQFQQRSSEESRATASTPQPLLPHRYLTAADGSIEIAMTLEDHAANGNFAVAAGADEVVQQSIGFLDRVFVS